MSTYTQVRKAQQARTDASKAKREAASAKRDAKKANAEQAKAQRASRHTARSSGSKSTKSTGSSRGRSSSSSSSDAASDSDSASDSDPESSSSEEQEDPRPSPSSIAMKGIQTFFLHYEDYEDHEDEVVEIVEMLADRKANLNATSKEGETLLLLAAIYGHGEVVKTLLSKGVKVDVADRRKKTPLHHAVDGDYPDMLRDLLEHKADIHAISAEGKTALMCAEEYEHDECVAVLKEYLAKAPAPAKSTAPKPTQNPVKVPSKTEPKDDFDMDSFLAEVAAIEIPPTAKSQTKSTTSKPSVQTTDLDDLLRDL